MRYLSTFHKEEVGAARLACAPPCACEEQRIDAFGARFAASVDVVRALPFTASERRCELRVTTLPAAASAGGGVGFKLTGVDVLVAGEGAR